MLDFWLMLFTMKLYSRKDIFKKQLLFIVFKGFNFVINFIINYPPQEILLNKRSELISKCRHENKNMLANIGNSGKRNNDSMD